MKLVQITMHMKIENHMNEQYSTHNFQPKRLLCCMKLISLGTSEKTWIRSENSKKVHTNLNQSLTNAIKSP